MFSATTKVMRHRGWLAIYAWVLVGCAHQVSQDKATGPDGRIKGARPIALDGGEGRARGIVTYPGGDRVDWKRIDLPAGSQGKLDLQLRWQAPRPGLQLAMDVFDQWNTPIAITKAAHRKGRVRSLSIDQARGTYFVRIYAPKRSDAGQYSLVATFDEVRAQGPIDPRAIEIPDPPRLAAVPEPEQTCDAFDPSNKACQSACPFDAPDGWKGCSKRDKQKADEEARKQAELERAERQNAAPRAITATAKHVELAGTVVRVKLSVGSATAPRLSVDWSAELLAGQTDKPLVGVRVKIVRVEKTLTHVELQATTDLLVANPRIRLVPPPL
jgi:hypothetical protein